MEVSEHVSQLAWAGQCLADAAEQAGLGASVPPCPGWQVSDLLHHVGGVHRWARSYLVTGRDRPTSAQEDKEFFADVPGPDLLEWFRQGHSLLVGSLSGAPPQLSCWSFLPAPSPLAFWARRQAHETAIHCADAQAAAGLDPAFPPTFAADGVDELLTGFFSRPRSHLTADPAVSLAISATDTGDEWTIVIGPERRRVSRGTGAADCTISGPASPLYLLLWNRLLWDRLLWDRAGPAAPIRVEGDTQVLSLWRDKATVTWS